MQHMLWKLRDMQTGAVISDLHLFTHRSTAAEQMQRIYEVARRSDFFVLNGDIFDFRWTMLDTVDETVIEAAEVLRHLAVEVPTCNVFYIMGNHDANVGLGKLLDALAEDVENFNWHPSHLRIGRNLFLHGDLPLQPGRADPLLRDLKYRERRRAQGLHVGYRVLVATRLHRLVAWMHSPQWCARRILSALRSFHPDLLDGLSDIYFGHIHKPFSDFRFDGIRFHNTGSAVRGLKCQLLEIRT